MALLSPFPYRVLYRIRAERIEVIGIRHVARGSKGSRFEV